MTAGGETPVDSAETVLEERLEAMSVTRISRVTEIKSGDATISTRAPVGHAPTKSREEIETARRLFMESYMKQLP